MKKEKWVFVIILRVVGLMERDGVFVSTTLRGVCRQAGKEYKRVAKRWERRGKGVDRICDYKDSIPWTLTIVELDTVTGRGGIANLKKGTGGMRGYKGRDGLLHPVPERKRTLADDILPVRQRGSIEGSDFDYES